MPNNVTEEVIKYSENNGTVPVTTTTEAPDDGASTKIMVPVIVGVLVAILLITAVVLFIICRRRKAQKNKMPQNKAGSGVYAETTAPLNDDESKVMLKTSNGTELEHTVQTKEPVPNTDELTNINESSPLKETAPSQPGGDPNESQATLVNNDGNALA